MVNKPRGLHNWFVDWIKLEVILQIKKSEFNSLLIRRTPQLLSQKNLDWCSRGSKIKSCRKTRNFINALPPLIINGWGERLSRSEKDKKKGFHRIISRMRKFLGRMIRLFINGGKRDKETSFKDGGFESFLSFRKCLTESMSTQKNYLLDWLQDENAILTKFINLANFNCILHLHLKFSERLIKRCPV